MSENLKQLAASAQQAMKDGRLDDALVDLSKLKKMLPTDGTIRLMTAFANRAKGELDTARQEFAAAALLSPNDLNIKIQYAGFLDKIGMFRASLEQYDDALKLAPHHIDFQIDRCLVKAKTRQRTVALEELRNIADANPTLLRAWSNLAILLREDCLFEAAEEAAQQILIIEPTHARAAHILAQCAFETGSKSSHLFVKARKAAKDNLALITGQAGALVQESKSEQAISLLEKEIAKRPTWAEGHRLLSEIHWQLSGDKSFTDSYLTVLKKDPQAIDLWINYIAAVSRALGHEHALPLIGEAQRHNPDNFALNNAAANSHSELENFEQAQKYFDQLEIQADQSTQLSYVRFLIKSKQYELAEKYGMDLVAKGNGADAWPFVSIAWRKLDDPRWNWLEGDYELTKAFDIEEIQDELPSLADRLRDMHKFEVHPYAQSLRGGTQTDGALFSAQFPEIKSLVVHLKRTITRYLDELPAFDETHPLLGMHRDIFRFNGSWSVRLTDAGFHVNHIHNQGNISSAFYVTVPELGDGTHDNHDGWLAVGEPATDLNTGLSAVKMIKPKPGRLALFPSTMWHGTRPFGEGERMSCAFDIGLYRD